MKWRIIFTLVIFLAGLGLGFYLWGFDNLAVTKKMGDIVNRAPTSLSEPVREDVAPKPLTVADITTGIVGKWRSQDDPSFTREFSVDASVVDTYGGDKASATEGRWAVFTAPAGEPPPLPIPEGTTYLKISTVEEVLYFKVLRLDTASLELVYLDGNGVQKFVRSK